MEKSNKEMRLYRDLTEQPEKKADRHGAAAERIAVVEVKPPRRESDLKRLHQAPAAH